MQLSDDVTALDPILRTSEQISGYGLVKRRGRGGVAEVWEADSPAGYRVALKLVHLSTDLRAGELRALKITRSIRHPSLLEIFGTWQVENLLVICMELADLSLWDRFLEVSVQGLRGVPRTELLGYLGSVAEAVDYLNDYKHSVAGREGVGVQHRDLKPQNILLLGGRAKVADFGLARVMEQAVASHTGPCTLPYAAPEYFGGKTSRQSDQYALAVTYCQLRGGCMPFHGSTAQITFGHLYNDPDLAGIPEPERPIVARALAKRPEERWPDCRSFIEALGALGAGEGGTVPDLLPREPGEGGPEQADSSGANLPSGLSLPSADSDFIPVDTGDLDLAGVQGGGAELGDPLATGASPLDQPSGAARFPRVGALVPWRVGAQVGRVAAAGMAGLRPRVARVGGRVAALTASGLALAVRGTRSLAARLRVGLAAVAAGLGPRLAHLVGQVAARTVRAPARLNQGFRALGTRLRAGLAARTAEFRPRFARGTGQAAARTAVGWATLTRGIRSLAGRLRVGERARSFDVTAGMAGLRHQLARIDRRAALTALGLALCAWGVWSLGARWRPAAPSSVTKVKVARPAPRKPALPVASRAPQGPRGDATAGTARPEETAFLATRGVGTPNPPSAGKVTEAASTKVAEAASTTPRQPAREPEPGLDAPVMPAPEPEPGPAPIEHTRAPAGGGAKADDAPAIAEESTPPAPPPFLVRFPPRATVPEALALTGPESMAPAPQNHGPTGPVAAVASLRDSRPRIPSPPTPMPAAPERIKAEDEPTRDASPDAGDGASDGDPGARPVPTPADHPAATPVSPPSLDVDVPATLSVTAGETTKLPVGVVRSDPSKPAHLDFHGLPRGLTVGDPTIPAGTDRADVALSASATTPAGTAEVKVVVTAGTERREAAIKVTTRPSPATVACERGQAELRRAAYDSAITAFTEAIRLDPDSLGAHFHRGVAHYLKGRFEDALADYTFALRVAPDSAEVRLARARVLRDLGKFGPALEDYTEAIRLRPDAKAYVARGWLQHEIGAYDQALADYETALGLRPGDPVAHFRRGMTRYILGESAGAISDFTEVIRRDPKHVGAYHYRGDAFARLGEYARAGADHDMFQRLSHPAGNGNGTRGTLK